MVKLWNALPTWLRETLKAAIIAGLASALTFLNSCTASHIVSQSSTTTTTKTDGTSESISTTIEYNQSGNVKK